MPRRNQLPCDISGVERDCSVCLKYGATTDPKHKSYLHATPLYKVKHLTETLGKSHRPSFVNPIMGPTKVYTEECSTRRQLRSIQIILLCLKIRSSSQSSLDPDDVLYGGLTIFWYFSTFRPGQIAKPTPAQARYILSHVYRILCLQYPSWVSLIYFFPLVATRTGMGQALSAAGATRLEGLWWDESPAQNNDQFHAVVVRSSGDILYPKSCGQAHDYLPQVSHFVLDFCILI